MTKLSLAFIQKAVARDRRFDHDCIDLDEQGKAIIYLADGWTWSAQDGERTVESFYIGRNLDEQPVDTVTYWAERVACIERIRG